MAEPPPPPRRLYVSPSQLQSLVSCERRWYLESQARAARDSDAGGQYLVFGRLVDQATEDYVRNPRVVLTPAGLAHRVKEARRGDELSSLTDDKWLELADRAIRALRRVAGLLPPAGTPSQFRYRVPVPGPDAVTLTGRADFRAPGRVWDVKSTSDRGPGRGRDDATPPRALTADTLRDGFQPRIYAAAEFFADPHRLSVELVWVYVSSQTNAVWAVRAVFLRAETLEWFESNVRPLFARMFELAETEGLAPEEARANHDGCARCFVKGACDPFKGAQQPGIGEYHVDIEKLRARGRAVNRPAPQPATPEPDLQQQLEASLVRSPLDALTREAAAVAGGTQDDRRADVVVAPTDTDDVKAILEQVPGEVAKVIEAFADTPPPDAADTVLALLTPGEAAQAVAADMDAPKPKRGRRRKGATNAGGMPGLVAAPAPRAPSPEEAARVAVLLASARTLHDAAVAAADAYSAVRNQLRAQGVDPDADADTDGSAA